MFMIYYGRVLKYKQAMQTHQTYFQYFSFGQGNFIDKVLFQKRKEIFNCFMGQFLPTSLDKVLDIGVSDEEHTSSNLFEKYYPYTENITAVGVDNFQHLEDIYPGLKFVQADGRHLPFADNSFDYVYSHAVIEHTGSRRLQTQFLAEARRVARKGIFITTPNRLHPIEFHTAIPLIHYLPHNWYRKIYQLLGKTFYSNEENLNLLTGKELTYLGKKASQGQDDITLEHTKFLFFNANLILIVKKGLSGGEFSGII